MWGTFEVRGPLDALGTVGRDVAVVVEFLFGEGAVARVDAEPFATGASSIAAANDVGEVESFTLEAGEFCAGGVEVALEGLALGLVAFGVFEVGVAFAAFHAREDGPEAVVFTLGDGIEFVVVAAGAVDGEAEGGGEDLGDDVVEVAGAGGATEHVALGFDVADEVPRSGGEESGCDDGRGVAWGEDIACDLFAEKAVVGFVVVEGIDDIIAVAPCVWADLVTFESVGVGVVGDVEPVPSPAFAVVGGGEEFVDEFFVGERVRVMDELVDSIGGGGEAV